MDTRSKPPSPIGPRETAGVEAVREALGAIANAEPAVFWLYTDYNGSWCARREGDVSEHQFSNREAARTFVHAAAARCSCYRLFIARGDGRFIEESFNWPMAHRHHHR